jgi:hypothetical protein
LNNLAPERNDTNETTSEPMIKPMIVVESDHLGQDESRIKKNVPAVNHTHVIALSPTKEAKKGTEEKKATGSPTSIAQASDIKHTHTTSKQTYLEGHITQKENTKDTPRAT